MFLPVPSQVLAQVQLCALELELVYFAKAQFRFVLQFHFVLHLSLCVALIHLVLQVLKDVQLLLIHLQDILALMGRTRIQTLVAQRLQVVFPLLLMLVWMVLAEQALKIAQYFLHVHYLFNHFFVRVESVWHH